MRIAYTVLMCALLATPSVAAQDNGSTHAIASIREDDVLRRIEVLAHDSMEGRATPSQGLNRAALYIAREFESLGIEPAGYEGTFVQWFYLAERELDVAESRVSVRGGPTWQLGKEILRYTGETGDDSVVGAPIVIAGIFSEASALDDIPIEGEVVLLLAPMGEDGGFASPFPRMLTLVRARRPAVLLMVTALSPSGWEARAGRGRGAGLQPMWTEGGSAPVLYIQDETIAPVLTEAGFDLAAARKHEELRAERLSDLEFSVRVRFNVLDRVGAPNVVGILRGRDPVLADEYVVLSAHMDHLGSRPGAGGDGIFNGADDNASGTAGVLELAEAFVRLDERPRRSLMFLLVSGEERGLWGSDYFVTDPPVALEQMVANINMDMIGRNWPDTIALIGVEHSSLGRTALRAAEQHPELNMTIIDDPWPDQRIYYRSDHYNFARRGIPILFFFNGTHEDYHRASDHVEKIDAEKEARLLRLIFHVAHEIANADDRPTWDQESYEAIVVRR